MSVRIVYKLPSRPSQSIDLGDDPQAHFQRLQTLIGGTLGSCPAPQGCPVADVQLYADDDGLLRHLAYNTVGLVGPVIAYKLAPDGEVFGMTATEVAAVGGWLDADGRPVGGRVFARPTGGEASSRSAFRLPSHVRRVDIYEATGGAAFKPQLHFTGAKEQAAELALVQRLLDRHGSEVVAFADEYTPDYSGFPPHLFFSLELQFADTSTGRAAMAACHAEYLAGPQDGRRRNRERKQERKRKQKRRRKGR